MTELCSRAETVEHISLIMAFRKRDLAFTFVAVYGFLLMLVLIEFKIHPWSTFCDWRITCVSFCCKNATLCKETTIRQTINQTAIEDFDDPEFTILYGKPTCSSLGPVKQSEGWRFTPVGTS